MKLLIRSVVAATIAIGVFLGAVSAVEEEYEGASYCRDYPAWPGGTYLGQMHPYHSDFYTGYAERRGWNACATWANDQRDSAVRGLRELGYSVTKPGASVPTPAPATQVGLQDQGAYNCGGEFTVHYRITEKNNLWWRFAYQVSIANNSDRAASNVYYEIVFYDAQGFKLDYGNGFFSLGARESTTISDDTLIDVALVHQVACVKFEL